MGCGTSGDPQLEKLSAKEGADILDTYLRLERDIWKEERAPPAPALGHEMVRLSKLSVALDTAQSEVAMDIEEHALVPGSLPDFSTMKGENHDDSIKRVIRVIGLNKNSELAAEHEEFIANLNRKAMRETRASWLGRRKLEAQDEVDRLTERVQHLQALYEHQESLISQLEREEEIEGIGELNRLRNYRDTLYSGELSWREAARLVEAASALARVAAADFEKAKEATDAESRWRHAVEARKGIHEATLCIQAAQIALPGVQFQYCTPREISTILQVIEYIFTDLQIPERYNHASQVYNTFYKRAAALHIWLKKIMEETIHKDVMAADQRFGALSTKVTNDRVNSIRQLAGLGTVKSYSQTGGGTQSSRMLLDSDLLPSRR